jgi:hypothetical protein
VIGSEQTPRFLIFLAAIFESKPTDGPGHSAAWAASCEGFAP